MLLACAVKTKGTRTSLLAPSFCYVEQLVLADLVVIIVRQIPPSFQSDSHSAITRSPVVNMTQFKKDNRPKEKRQQTTTKKTIIPPWFHSDNVPVAGSCTSGVAEVPRRSTRLPSSWSAHTSTCWLAVRSAVWFFPSAASTVASPVHRKGWGSTLHGVNVDWPSLCRLVLPLRGLHCGLPCSQKGLRVNTSWS